jgi:hypothetical protein
MGFVRPNYRAPMHASRWPVTITDPGNVFPTINTIDCLAWPSEAWRTGGGTNAWAGWSATKGDRGIAIAKTKHCFMNETVVFVEIGLHYVPIAQSGIAFESGTIDELPSVPRSSSP